MILLALTIALSHSSAAVSGGKHHLGFGPIRGPYSVGRPIAVSVWNRSGKDEGVDVCLEDRQYGRFGLALGDISNPRALNSPLDIVPAHGVLKMTWRPRGDLGEFVPDLHRDYRYVIYTLDSIVGDGEKFYSKPFRFKAAVPRKRSSR
jgi:hypothetical protein